jgi:GAF domain-containing protein
MAILFATDLDSDQVVSIESRTIEGQSGYTVSMPLGSGVSGWVAVNGTPMLNAEAALDFRLTVAGTELVRMLCVPVRVRGGNAGVLSLYVNDRRGFSEEDKAAAQQIVASLESEEPAKSFDVAFQGRIRTSSVSPTVH